jgi:hypothetical protein
MKWLKNVCTLTTVGDIEIACGDTCATGLWAVWRLEHQVIPAEGVLVVAENTRKLPWKRTFP